MIAKKEESEDESSDDDEEEEPVKTPNNQVYQLLKFLKWLFN